MKNDCALGSREDVLEFLDGFSPRVAKRGKDLAARGSVRSLSKAARREEWEGEVTDRGTYGVSLVRSKGAGWVGYCSCAQEAYCAHIYAAVWFALEPGKAVPERIVIEPSATPFARLVIKALGRPLERPERDYLQRLERVYAECSHGRPFSYWDCEQLSIPQSGFGWNVPRLWPKFPQDVHQFWLHLAHYLQTQGQSLPEFLQPISELDGVGEQITRWRRDEEIQRWRELLLRQPAMPAAPDTPPRLLDMRVRLLPDRAVLELQEAGQGEFTLVKSALLRDLEHDYRAGEVELSPDGEILWREFQQRYLIGRSTELRYTDPESSQALSRLLRSKLPIDRFVTSPGAPYARAQEPLRWELTPAASPLEDYRLRLVQSNGEPVPKVLLTIAGRPALYITEHTVFTGPPPRSLAMDTGTLIPAPALETQAGVRFLRDLAVPMPTRIPERLRTVPFEVRIHCGLHRPYRTSASEYCAFDVSAHSADGHHVLQWHGSGWLQRDPQPAKPGETNGALVFYDQAALGPVPALMAPLALKADIATGVPMLRVTRQFPEILAHWLQTVPAGIPVALDDTLASLALAPIAGRVRLDVAETEIDWFDLRVVLDVSDTTLTQDELKLLLDAKGRFVRLGAKGWKRLAFDLTPEEDEQLARLGLNPHELTSEPQRMHALQLADPAARRFLPEAQAVAIHRRADEIKARVTPPLPPELKAELRPYQVEGYHFLAYLAANRFGGILADDMGLGKTVQALAWLLWLRAQQPAPPSPSLVVCPKSVMDNWRAEGEKFAATLRVRVWPARELERLPAALDEADLHVINYSQLRGLGEALAPVHWLAVILDEGQYIKNPNSQTAQIARALHAGHRLVLSGTPIENRLMDLWSLITFAMPGLLGSRAHFGRVYSGKEDPLARRRLAARVRPFLLRRTKGQVAKDLPDRIEEDLYCEIEGEQKTLYLAELKRARQMLLQIQTQSQLAKEQFHFLTSLLRLRQICCHPRLVRPASTAESAKVAALLDQLEPLMAEGQKVLVFSQFVELLQLLKPVMAEREWPTFYLAGETENRGELVRNFQAAEGAAVFLISLKAGGFGLNLTAASYVVLFDPWWNPAVENQAIDRTHRIGQTRKVIAYRLLIKDSIEEKIRILQRQKKALAEDILGEERFSQSLTLDDFRFLFAD